MVCFITIMWGKPQPLHTSHVSVSTTQEWISYFLSNGQRLGRSKDHTEGKKIALFSPG